MGQKLQMTVLLAITSPAAVSRAEVVVRFLNKNYSSSLEYITVSPINSFYVKDGKNRGCTAPIASIAYST